MCLTSLVLLLSWATFYQWIRANDSGPISVIVLGVLGALPDDSQKTTGLQKCFNGVVAATLGLERLQQFEGSSMAVVLYNCSLSAGSDQRSSLHSQRKFSMTQEAMGNFHVEALHPRFPRSAPAELVYL